MIGAAQMLRDRQGNLWPFGWLLLLAITSLFIGLSVAGVLPSAHLMPAAL